MLRNLTIAWRMTLLILIGAGLILGVIIGYSYMTARRLLEQELADKACYLARATASHIETVQHSVEKIAQGIAYDLERNPSLDDQYALLEAMVRRNKEIYGAAIAPAKTADAVTVAPYVCRPREPGGRFSHIDLAADENYSYDVQDWYTLPHDLGHAVWTEPYYDEGAGSVLMVTYAVPIRSAGCTNDFRGVTTCDVSLEWLTDLLKSLPVGQSGYAFLISSSGIYMAHPRRDFIMNETVFSVAEANNNSALRRIGQHMIHGDTGVDQIVSLVTGKPSWFAYAPVPTTGWAIGLVFPRQELLTKVISLTRDLSGLGVIGFALLLVVALAIARSITRPLRQLQAATKMLSNNLDATLPKISGEDEVAQLASAFEAMRNDLKAHIERLRTTTAAKERIESEIHIARSIQMSLVPRTFPPFPERRDLDIFAMLDPARDIGGDFYDFFLDGNDALCLVIGDVSGKGVPAALFMAVTRTFLRTLWHEERDPSKTLSRLNDELARDNEPTMFVTLFLARIDLRTGRCQYANGGHNPPFIIRGNAPVERIRPVKGTLVGGMEGMLFEEGSMEFRPGDTLFLYTDGVTEAMNPADELTGEEWTLGQIEQARGKACDRIVYDIREELRKYAGGAEQSDDITMVVFRYFGPNGG